MNTKDEQFVKQLVDTLENSNTQLDPDVKARLASLRREALNSSAQQQPKHRRYVSQPRVLAAVVTVCVITVGISQWLKLQEHSRTTTVAMSPATSEYWQEDPALLADWEMVDALGDDPNAS